MVQIISDSPEIEKKLRRLESLTVKGGGWVHPDLRILSNDGDLRVEFEGSDEGAGKLVLLTREILLPVKKVEIYTEGDGKLNFKPVNPDALSKIRHELFEVVFDLYNATDKIQFTRESNFWTSLKDDLDIMEKVVAARSSGPAYQKMKDFLKKDVQDKEMLKYLVERFVSMRVLGFGGKGDDGKNSGQGNMPVLMPIIDCFNHHYRGGRFQSSNHDTLEVWCSKPIEGSNECFGFYGPMDAMDAYLRYGFVDAHAALVRSIPVQVDVPNIGRIVVESKTPYKMNTFKLAKEAQDLESFMPNIQHKYDVMTLSHLYIPAKHSPYAMRRVLGGCLKQLIGESIGPDELREILRGVEQKVIDENLIFYSELTSYMEAVIKNKSYTNKSAADTVLLLSRTQEKKIRSYKTINQEKD